MPIPIRRILVFGILCFFSLLALYPLFSVQVWNDSHARYSYLYQLQEFKDIFNSGVLYPRWAPRFLAGYGYPFFLFYQPGVFFFILPFMYLPLALPVQLTIAVFLMFLISAWGAYRLARHFGMDRFVSAVTSSIYLFMPYAYANLYVRGDLSEFFSMMLCPWVMVGVKRIRKDAAGPVRWSSLAVYVLSLVAVFFSHPLVSLFLILIIVWFAVVDWIVDGPRSRSAWLLALGGVMAAVITAPYWFTVLNLASYIKLSDAMVQVQQSMRWGEVFYRTDADHYPWWLATMGVLSLFYIGLAFCGLILIHKDRLFWQALPPLLLTIYLNTNDSLPLWHVIPGSAFIQFAWRIDSVSGLLQYLGAIQLCRLGKRLSPGDYHLGVLIIIFMGILFQPSVEFDSSANRFVLKAFAFNRYLIRLQDIPSTTFLKPFTSTEGSFWSSTTDEWDPVWLDKNALLGCFPHHDDEPINTEDAGVSIHVEKKLLPYEVRGSVDIDSIAFPAEAASADALPGVTLNRVYFPGWVETINHRPVSVAKDVPAGWKEKPTARMDSYGRIQLFFPRPGHYELDGYYEGPPHWQLRNIIMCLLTMALCFICVRCRLVRHLSKPGA